jgi:hypothetical protein
LVNKKITKNYYTEVKRNSSKAYIPHLVKGQFGQKQNLGNSTDQTPGMVSINTIHNSLRTPGGPLMSHKKNCSQKENSYFKGEFRDGGPIGDTNGQPQNLYARSNNGNSVFERLFNISKESNKFKPCQPQGGAALSFADKIPGNWGCFGPSQSFGNRVTRSQTNFFTMKDNNCEASQFQKAPNTEMDPARLAAARNFNDKKPKWNYSFKTNLNTTFDHLSLTTLTGALKPAQQPPHLPHSSQKSPINSELPTIPFPIKKKIFKEDLVPVKTPQNCTKDTKDTSYFMKRPNRYTKNYVL